MTSAINYEKKWVDAILSEASSGKRVAEDAIRDLCRISNHTVPSFFIWSYSPEDIDLVWYIFNRCDSRTFSIIQECGEMNFKACSDNVWEDVWKYLGPRLPGKISPEKVKKIWEKICLEMIAQADTGARREGLAEGFKRFDHYESIDIWERFGNAMEEAWKFSGIEKMPAEKQRELIGQEDVRKIEHIREAIFSELSRKARAEGNMYSRPPMAATRHKFYRYEWYNDVLKLGYDEHIKLIMITAKQCFDWITVKNVCILIENPVRVKCNGRGRLHSDENMAIEFKDGFGLWRLSGVRVPKAVVVTPREELSSSLMLSERNIDIRREIARKIGIEKICKDLKAKCVDSWENYELLLLDLGDESARPYLKMLNPSIGTYHIEGVDPSCVTVKSALAWRNGLNEYKVPEVLT
jgi:hypothetical protein